MKSLFYEQFLFTNLFMNERYKLPLEIHRLFEDHRGSFSSISGYLGRNDSGKISRQLSPSDDSRDNPYLEIVDIHSALISFAPQLEEQIWQILERERKRLRKDAPSPRAQPARPARRTYQQGFSRTRRRCFLLQYERLAGRQGARSFSAIKSGRSRLQPDQKGR